MRTVCHLCGHFDFSAFSSLGIVRRRLECFARDISPIGWCDNATHSFSRCPFCVGVIAADHLILMQNARNRVNVCCCFLLFFFILYCTIFVIEVQQSGLKLVIGHAINAFNLSPFVIVPCTRTSFPRL